MTEPRPREPLIPSIARVTPLVLVLGLVAVLVSRATRPLTNDDTYFHLRFGQEFLDAWSAREPGSVNSYGTADWVPTQWLSQIAMAGLENAGGLPGVAWLSGFLMAVLVLVLYAAARQVADPTASSVAVILAIMASSLSLSMRPHLLSFILTVVTWWIWHRAHVHGSLPWGVIPLTWAWAMLHGMWPLGLIIGLTAAVGIGFDTGMWRRFAQHLGLLAVAAGAAGLTPVGPRLYGAVLEVSGRGQYFPEWSSPDFWSFYGVAIGLMLGICILILTRKSTPTDWFDLLLIALAGALAVYSIRTVPVAAALLTPFVAGSLQHLIGARSAISRAEKTALGLGTALILALMAFIIPVGSALTPGEEDWVSAQMTALPAGTIVLNQQTRGGYLMWRYPSVDFVMNGYGDIYTTPELEGLVDLIGVRPGWDKVARETGAEVALLDPTSALTYALRLCGWETTRTSNDLELLQAPAGWLSSGSCSVTASQP